MVWALGWLVGWSGLVGGTIARMRHRYARVVNTPEVNKYKYLLNPGANNTLPYQSWSQYPEVNYHAAPTYRHHHQPEYSIPLHWPPEHPFEFHGDHFDCRGDRDARGTKAAPSPRYYTMLGRPWQDAIGSR
jgi:hypothetical protein